MFQHVIEIPQTQKDHPIWDQQLRVAAYCRTSTNQEEQNSSLENQIAYYTAFIQSNPMWRFVAVYADQASGLHTKPSRLSEAPERLPEREDRFDPRQITQPLWKRRPGIY